MNPNHNPLVTLIHDLVPPAQAREHKDKPRKSRIVQVDVKTQYGSQRFYPANEEAWSFLRIQGGRTLTQDTLRNVADLGYRVKFNQEEIKL